MKDVQVDQVIPPAAVPRGISPECMYERHQLLVLISHPVTHTFVKTHTGAALASCVDEVCARDGVLGRALDALGDGHLCPEQVRDRLRGISTTSCRSDDEPGWLVAAVAALERDDTST